MRLEAVILKTKKKNKQMLKKLSQEKTNKQTP